MWGRVIVSVGLFLQHYCNNFVSNIVDLTVAYAHAKKECTEFPTYLPLEIARGRWDLVFPKTQYFYSHFA